MSGVRGVRSIAVSHPEDPAAPACGGESPAGGASLGLIGCSAAIRDIVEQLRCLARSTAPVLVCGETGTGKEVIGRALHAASPRAGAPYVAVNCAALPPDLIESELFGYRRGAFSGAAADYPGLLRAAAGGTMLLDEITEMRPALQAKLLRVLQEGAVRPVGSLREHAVDVRFVASTNRDLDAALRCGQLRADLYYRLAVGVIALPPLRERPEDIPLLVEHQLARLHARYGAGMAGRRTIGGAALDVLRAHAWPGNVRELFNVIERAFLHAASSEIRAADLVLSPAWRTAPAPPRTGAARGRSARTFAEHERELLEHALGTAGGNKTRAARQLGISRKKLYARIAKYAL